MEYVEVTVDDAVALIRIDRPPMNALSAELAAELAEAVAGCAAPEIRAVVMTGRPHFAAGADIKAFKATLDSGSTERSASALTEAISAFEALAKPTIAAVHGYALGGGLELAMGADFRYLAEDARVGQPEILLGIIPGAGGTQRLARLVGFQRAKELVLSGRQVDAEEAHRIGLADKVLPADDLLDTAMADAAEWATKATRAVAAAKTALHGGFGRPLSEGLSIERDAFQDAFGSEDAKEGIDAFVAKREPQFRGR